MIAFWAVHFALAAIFQCDKSYPAEQILFISTPVIFIVLAWAISAYESLSPSSFKNIAILTYKTSFEFILILIIGIFLLLPVAMLIPHYNCYTERAYNAEVLMQLMPTKLEVTELIKRNGTTENDYSGVIKPSTKRIDFISVTAEGIILAHAKEPDFTVYLTPTTSDGKVLWSCKAFPPKKSPVMCR